LSPVCPIGGTEHCKSCRYPVNPQNFKSLRQCLNELSSLRNEGVLSESEYAVRRRLLVEFGKDRTPEGFRIAAWIVGAFGVILTGSGLWLALTFDILFGTLVIGGALMLALSFSFSVLSGNKDSAEDLL
jgi:hypothetical protein